MQKCLGGNLKLGKKKEWMMVISLCVCLQLPAQTIVAPGVSDEGQGAGLVFLNLDNKPGPEILLMAYDAPPEDNTFRYRIGWNVNEYGIPTGWSSIHTLAGVGWEGQGAGVAAGQLDGNPRPDLVLMAYDNPDKDNSFRYKIGWNINQKGIASHWSDIIQVGGVGWEAQGAGAALADLDGNGVSELVLMAYDNPNGSNNFRLRIGWNLDALGKANTWTTLPQLPGMGDEAEGADLAIAQLGGGPEPDLLLMAYDGEPGGRKTIRRRIGWDLNQKGIAAKWTDLPDLPGFGFKGQGAGLAIHDISAKNTPDIVYMVYNNTPGANSFRYHLNPEIKEALEYCGASYNPSGSPFGGGEGYAHIFGKQSAKHIVKNKSGLLLALKSASRGDIIYVEDNASINLTGEKNLVIPGGVTLASGRGRKGALGGLIYTDQHGTNPLFQAGGEGVRLTGVRLRGPDPDVGSQPYTPPISTGIDSLSFTDLQVDNSELSAWSYAAVKVTSQGAYIHHCHIHHNRRTGLGYGVLLHEAGEALIEANLFDNNRHDIAGSGYPDQKYEARYNMVGRGTTSHAFDMHGENENLNNGSPHAGDTIYIHHNTFLEAGEKAVMIRGRPKNHCWVENNIFAHRSIDASVQQRHHQGNLTQTDNCFGYQGWYISQSGTARWKPLNASRFYFKELRFGDFVGDAKTDVFVTSKGRWYVSESGIGPWQPLAFSGYAIDRLRFGNFIGDAKTDVFVQNGNQWQVSESGTGSWTSIASSGYALQQLRFGDFVGDDRTDVFTHNGTRWMVSDGGAGSWQNLAKSGYPLSRLRFGDFVGDHKTDVFVSNNSQWHVSGGGSASWQGLARSSTQVEQLRFGDFVGDTKADVFLSHNGKWRVSESGAKPWQDLNSSGFGVDRLRFFDMAGDDKTDIFVTF